MEVIRKNAHCHFSGYQRFSNKEKEDIDDNDAEISLSKFVLYFIFLAIMIIILIIIIIALTYIFIIKNNIKKSKRVKHHEISFSHMQKMKAARYVNDCINGNLYDKNKYKKTENPKISIIIPIYNKEKFIIRILRSIQNQSFKDIEIIFCDDGSNDNSTKLIEKISKGR